MKNYISLITAIAVLACSGLAYTSGVGVGKVRIYNLSDPKKSLEVFMVLKDGISNLYPPLPFGGKIDATVWRNGGLKEVWFRYQGQTDAQWVKSSPQNKSGAFLEGRLYNPDKFFLKGSVYDFSKYGGVAGPYPVINAMWDPGEVVEDQDKDMTTQ